MRAICPLVIASLVAACAPAHVGTWRADGSAPAAATDPASRIAEARGARWDDDDDRDRFDDGDEVIGCLGQAAVIGGVAAVIYLTRFRGRGGGGDGETAGAEVAPVVPADPAPRWAGPALSPEVAAIVEAEPADGALRPCGVVCGEALPAAPGAP